MPELPEVETICRQLAPRVAGRTVTRLEVIDPLWCAPRSPAEFGSAVAGRGIVDLERRGKYLVMSFDAGRFLVMHLRMTGNLLWVQAADDEPRRRYLRARFLLDNGHRLLFVDPRRFGTCALLDTREELNGFLGSRVGQEPLEAAFTADVLARQAAGRRAPVKAFLLDQRRVAGIGNIYADEALFRARIHPLKPAGRLTRPQLERLHDGIVDSLRAGVEAFGASIDRFRDSDGAPGSMQERFLVHRREGLPCLRCGRKVVKLRAAGRGTYVCRRCQPAPRSGHAKVRHERQAGRAAA